MAAQPLREVTPQSADTAISMAMEQGRDDKERAEILFSLLRAEHRLLVEFAQRWVLQAVRQTKVAANRVLWKREAEQADHLASASRVLSARLAYLQDDDNLYGYGVSDGTRLRDATLEHWRRHNAILRSAIEGRLIRLRFGELIEAHMEAQGIATSGEIPYETIRRFWQESRNES